MRRQEAWKCRNEYDAELQRYHDMTPLRLSLVSAGPVALTSRDLSDRDAALLVDRCWEALTALLAELHRRLMRSLHIAVLHSRLSSDQLKIDPRFNAFHKRLIQLITSPLSQASHAEVLRLAEQLMRDEYSDRHQLAGTLMACLGTVPPPQAMPTFSGDFADEVCLCADLARGCAPFADVTYNTPV
ncbi:MAG: hypothetical protein J6386_26165 [Candidatus Synoicihabitans palmerolidicus]|nr:hypothetical protein [Candidatus Synoicihabitans palmerolidicus]MCC5023875.1 hypothetical protein [Candidatus Synoicihabitans palmerolidicus]MCC5025213.1 hypothetical protein [Candidatus Synoicihabitans palmerolidicus]MCC5025911.1 hypothetical protein [Candidatus Synoicihabitans palmerolidicus]MCC5025946.1 hypothetical protein [Candidatus Synoicihabitans palmerolidicus]